MGTVEGESVPPEEMTMGKKGEAVRPSYFVRFSFSVMVSCLRRELEARVVEGRGGSEEEVEVEVGNGE